MQYLLDTNVLVDANRDYYPIERAPKFWEWLIHEARRAHIAIPKEIVDEVKAGAADDLTRWIRREDVIEAIGLEDEPDFVRVSAVVARGYAPDLTDAEIEQLGVDPILIAYALDLPHRCIVTTEASKPGRQRANRHVPDVCASLGIRCVNTFQMVRDLGFSTNWQERLG